MEKRDRWMAAQNINRFEEKLALESEPARRKVLEKLIEQERVRLKES